MRKILFAMLVITSINVFAISTAFENINEDVCQKYEIKDGGDTLICYDSVNANNVMRANVDFSKQANLNGIYLWDIVEMGVMPDDSTSHRYNYKHDLYFDGKHVGFFQVIAAYNSEGEWGVKLVNRYDLTGQLVLSKYSEL